MNQHQSHNELVVGTGGGPLLPVSPRVAISVRAGTLADVAFMDSLQKATTKQVGWMPTKQFEGKVAAGHVLVAEVASGERRVSSEELSDAAGSDALHAARPVGYLIGNDQYFKRDDVGIIYQMNVVPEYRRSLVAAALLKAQFERSAYGCKLYCCWCAQDIEANRFWEAMGFVPLAFRSGSEQKGRTHIFWQKRIRAGDEATPWWFPSQTTGGAIREDRLVLPIPPGVSWRDEMPRVLPSAGRQLPNEEPKQLPGTRSAQRKAAIASRPSDAPAKNPPVVLSGGMRFAAPVPAPAPPEKKPREPRKKQKNDPHLVAAARELRDRWLDEVNAGRFLPAANGRYDVSRAIGGPEAVVGHVRRLTSPAVSLPEAA